MKTLLAGSLVVWLVAALVAGWFDVLTQPDAAPINIGLFILVPIGYFVALYQLSGRFRDLAHRLSLPLLVGAHTWRYVGVGFVLLFYFGQLPAGFGIPEGVGDILAAVFALPLALALRRGKAVRGWFIAWNIFGVVDLISAVTMGLLYSRSNLGVLRTDISSEIMTSFPLSLIPSFLVPLFILTHLLALARFREVRATAVMSVSEARSAA